MGSGVCREEWDRYKKMMSLALFALGVGSFRQSGVPDDGQAGLDDPAANDRDGPASPVPLGKPKSALARLLLPLALSLCGALAQAEEVFTDGSQAAGLDFTHFNGMSDQFYLVENLGGGAALFDYDNDGDLDLYLVQGRMLGEGKTLADARFPPKQDQVLQGRLYRNDLTAGPDGRPRGHLTDVTQASGLNADGYGMGVTTGDYDNDGHTDLFLTNLGGNMLWHNNGDGTFANVTVKAGVGESRLAVSSAFLDFDRDGWLDLYVAEYVDFTTANNKPCHAPSSARDYCSPKVYEPLPDRLYRNKGDGTFTDVSATSRVAQSKGTGLGVVAADFNGDDWPDIYVANDGLANFLWINQKDGAFLDDGLISGTAVNSAGMAEASMGVDACDLDSDGDLDLFMTHLTGETNTLYLNDGQGWFEDRTAASGLGGPSKAMTAFGTGCFDYDNDADLDLYVANGAVNIILSLVKAADPYPLHQPNQLFANLGEGRFADVSAESGTVFALSEVSRGVAFGDIDNDGDSDLVVVNNNGPARLLINQVGSRNPWLGLRLIETHGRDALGAWVEIRREGMPSLWRRVHTDGSYASAGDPRLLVGLAGPAKVTGILVRWPSGRREAFPAPDLGRYSELREGQGTPEAAP